MCGEVDEIGVVVGVDDDVRVEVGFDNFVNDVE